MIERRNNFAVGLLTTLVVVLPDSEPEMVLFYCRLICLGRVFSIMDWCKKGLSCALFLTVALLDQ